MSTRFCGHRTGFNPTGENDVTPMFDGVKTEWRGRPVVPKGPLKVPKGLADISNSNRRMAKAMVGGGENAVHGTNAFSRGKGK